jgi:serine/threonine protein kinase
VPHDPASAAKGTTDRVRTDRREEGLSPTLDGSAIGTPAYMSPEQARGELDKLDPRSDIWSLGAILYEILTFERAIEGATPMMALANAAKGRVLPPEQRAPSRFIPRELSAIAMKCLHKVRSRRYPTVLDLKRDISLFLEGRSVSAAPDTFGQAVVKLVKRNRGTSASIATAAAILIAVTVAFLLRLKGERDHALASEARALRGEQAAVVAQQRQRATALEASEALARQAVRAAEEGRLAEAEVRADAALRVLPDGPWGHYALAILALEKKDLASARRLLDAALSSDPTHGPSSAAMAQLGLAEGKIAEAASLLKRVEEVKDWRSLLAAGNVFMSAQSSPMR